jgi:hypothetical protein
VAVQGRFSSRVRRFFVKVEAVLASTVLLDLLIHPAVPSSPSFIAVIRVWAVLAFILLLGYLFMTIPRVQRFFYYRIWLGVLLSGALRLTGGIEGCTRDTVRPTRTRFRWLLSAYDLPYENWIRESAEWTILSAHKTGFVVSPHPPNTPVFVQRDHLTVARRWPGQSFAMTILFKPVLIKRTSRGEYQLSVDLTDEAYGIYKNRGKQFLYDRLLQLERDVPREEVRNRSTRLHRFAMEATQEPGEITAGGPYQPLRWSSAGALPLVHWRKPGQEMADDWFVLFFRGIRPVGWNLANGASESAREWRNLFEVGVRELCEELVVLEGPPVARGKPTSDEIHWRRPFRPGQAANAYPDLVGRLTGHDFVHEHNNLRDAQDGITIKDDESRPLRLHEVDTRSRIVVTDDRESFPTENLIFTINPLETGIESIFMFKFDLADNDYLLFGEVLEDLKALAREPVMLLRRSFVEREIESNGSLGDPLPDPERVRLREIPADDYHIFDADIALRERRLRNILNDLEIQFGEISDPAEAARLRDDVIARQLAKEKSARRGRTLLEARFHANWFAEYGEQFAALAHGGPVEAPPGGATPLLELCAVTWKTLEFVCRHKIGT